jgi:hypothetical protein
MAVLPLSNVVPKRSNTRTEIHLITEIDGRFGLVEREILLFFPRQILLQFSQQQKQLWKFGIIVVCGRAIYQREQPANRS